MRSMRSRRWIAFLLLLAFSGAALAQAFPGRSVTLVVPNPPGGAIDIQARIYAQKLQDFWGQPVIVDYKPGAGTLLGMEHVAKSAPDGHTLCLVVTPLVILPALREKMPYDTLKDLAPVTLTGVSSIMLAAAPGLQASNVAELIALARKNPGKLSYATPGSGTSMHLSIELLKTQTGIDLVHVPYKGGAPAQQDVMAGRVPILLDVLYAVQPLIDSGKIKVIALLSPTRPASAKGYEVVAETVPGVSALSMVGLVAAGGTPRDLVQKISSDVARAVKGSDLTERMTQLGMEPVGSTPAEFDALIRAEIEKWSRVVRISGAKAD